MREKFEGILKDHGICGDDIEELLYSVSDMLKLVAEETKKNEPYATNSIDRLETAAYEVSNLATEL